ncbi:MAG: PLP-dependent aminotransferase family protein [Rhodospirillales bacterium]|nr:PLP-dependent aminotransferase family protein [Rhodospirillales bacterium]
MDGFDITAGLAADAPAPAPRFGGFPRYNFIGGHNDPALIPLDGLIAAATAALTREGRRLATYNLSQGPQGYLALREFVAGKLTTRRGVAATAGDVLITSGSGQGIDIVNRLLVTPGDTVLIEEFSYAGAITRARQSGATVMPMPLDDQGIRPEAVEAILADLAGKGKRAKYIYTIPTIQNPTGSILPLERRRALIALSAKYGVPIFEDECYADLLWHDVDAPPALRALAPAQVVHIGSFSKSLAPALRLGYASADWPMLARMIACKSDGGTGAVDQMVAAEYFATHFAEHVDRLSTGLSAKLAVMQEAVAREFGTAVETWAPRGGIFLWLKLPDEVDVRKLVQPALDAGVAFNPGPEWAVDAERAKSHLRLCFALPTAEEIREGVAAFARVCREQTGIPRQSANIRH